MKCIFKKIVAASLILTMLAAITGCGKDKVELALITDVGTVEDGSYNQGTWEGIKKYAIENAKNYAYYQPKQPETSQYMASIKEAVSAGAKVIVCPGYLPEVAVFEAQSKYPKVHFILVDGQPHSADYSDTTIKKNVMAISFSEVQAGFLAGYAAVRDGYTHLGFMGGEPEEAVIRFGYGFVQGADYAAIEMNIKADIEYCYSNTYFESAEVVSMADEWYQNGTEVIFACGGAMGRSVMEAAEYDADNRKVIGVDVDQSGESKTIITSAMKMLSNAVYDGIDDYYQDNFAGGSVVVLDAANSGVGLPMNSSQFRKFGEADYDQIYTRLVDGSILPCDDTDTGTTQDLNLVNVTVEYVPF